MRRVRDLVTPLCTIAASLFVVVLPAAPQTMQAVTAAARQSVCIVLAERGNGTTSGTGFMVADGYLLTSHHVVQGADRLRVLCPEHPAIEVKMVNADADNDVALLQSNLLNIRPLPLGASANVQVGQEITVIGYPRADLVAAEAATVTQGIVNSVRGGALQIQAPVGPGSSGSPVLTLQGQVIGVVRAVLGSQVGTNLATSFATAIDAAKPFLTSALGGLYGSVNVGNSPPAQPPKPIPTSSRFVITPGQGIGDLRLGMPRNELEKLMGPAKHSQTVNGGILLDWQSDPIPRRGLWAVVSRAGEAIMIGADLDPRYVIPVQGLHTGDREVEVRGALGEPSRVELTTLRGIVAALKEVSYDSLGLKFIIANNPEWGTYGQLVSIAVYRLGCVFTGWPPILQSGTCQQ
jgi:putative serine protease PepD